MRQGTIVTIKPDGVALSVAEAKRQLRIEFEDTDQDEHISDLCNAANSHIERELGYPIIRQTRETHLSGFPRGAIWLGGGHGIAVKSVRYRDRQGVLQALDPSIWALDAVSRPAAVYPSAFASWPSVATMPSAVIVEWEAGWINPSDVPDDLIHAMKLLVSHWDQNREVVIVGTIAAEVQVTLKQLLQQFYIPFVA